MDITDKINNISFRIGNKLVCRKEFHTSRIVFLKDTMYNILNIEVYGFYIRVKVADNGNHGKYYYFYTEDIFDYFCTNQELRKLKLERLRNV